MANDGEDAGLGNNRGRDESPKKRQKPEGDVSVPGHLDIDPTEAGLAALNQRIEIVEGNFASLESTALEEIGDVKEAIDMLTEEHRDGLTNLELKLTEAVSASQGEIEALKQQLETARLVGGAGQVLVRETKIEGPKPKEFRSERNAQDVENFIWKMEDYFEHLNLVDEAAKIRAATMRQFYPQNVVNEARRKLRELKQTTSIREYVKEFTKLILQIPNMSSDDLLFYFMDGLQNWAKQELQRRQVKDVDEAIAVVESLTDYRTEATKAKDTRNKLTKPGGDQAYKGKQVAAANTGRDFKREEHRSHWRDRGKRKGLAQGVAHAGEPAAPEKRDVAHLGHMMLGALLTKEPALKQVIQDKPNLAQMGQNLLGAVMGKEPRLKEKGSLFVDAKLNGQSVRIMVDTGATHNFVTGAKAKSLGLVFSPSNSLLKTVNANLTNVNGVARNVQLNLGAWQGCINFFVAPMDVFDIVLGLDYWDEVMGIISPGFNQIYSWGPRGPCVVPTVRVPQAVGQLSAMQIVKGFKRGEATFLAAVSEIEEDKVDEALLPCVQQVLEENKDVMPEELPKCLTPRREVDYQIELISGAKPPAMGPYRMAPPELEELRKQLKELLEARHVRPSKAPFGAPVLFQKKQDGSLRLCIDYRALNKVTVKNKYPIPLTADLFDRLGQAKVFSKMDLGKGYYQVRIAEGDEPKTTCVTRYGAFEWLVMPFVLTDAPATFSTLMHKLFHPVLDQFVVIYLDIVIYSSCMEEHLEHLRKVFQVLRENDLFVKREKCSFAQPQVQFLGHTISQGQIRMDSKKVAVIRDWEAPTKVTELRSFLGLANYYRRFILGYSAIAAPLTDLLKKDHSWEWTDFCQGAFESQISN
ncbi:PREDICTED: uncharacterized protein LOC109218379 [Nicotiana attenuata]|uniref:uncharacterized protein LOC109218379 n=1 Tax=Nicotiana attenuata TaxID=49451 RepID=UPI000905CDC0|nr:PREDICTED: uncharacterized protein LOC109218379 [Nicotiana attenuata]